MSYDQVTVARPTDALEAAIDGNLPGRGRLSSSAEPAFAPVLAWLAVR